MVHLVLAEEAADQAAVLAMDQEIQAEVDAATAAARAAPYPPAEAAFAHILEEGDLWPRR
jgi:TPP-dependent pyruvate/acetoin dehydrogenase alpha subunit